MKQLAISCPLLLALACGRGPAPTKPPSPTSTSSSSTAKPRESPGVRMPCDPISSREPAPPPPDPGAVCGNGVVDALAGTCEKICGGGCDAPIECHVACTTPRETCDGADNDYTCASQGYAGGTMRCTPACGLDDDACVACVPGPDVRCGATAVGGDEPFAVAGPRGAAVFARDAATGRLSGARVDAKLKTHRFNGLPTHTLVAGALDGALGFVDDHHRFGVIDAATGRARMLGPIGADSNPIYVLRESFGAGGAVVLTGDYQRRTLAVFDGAAAAADGAPRHFALDNLRVVVVPATHELARGATTGGADLVVLAFGNEVYAYQRDGLELTKLAAVPTGIAMAFTYPVYTDALTWSSGERVATARTSPGAASPPAGLSRAALGGASFASAFGGSLLASVPRGPHRRVELYWTRALALGTGD